MKILGIISKEKMKSPALASQKNKPSKMVRVKNRGLNKIIGKIPSIPRKSLKLTSLLDCGPVIENNEIKAAENKLVRMLSFCNIKSAKQKVAENFLNNKSQVWSLGLNLRDINRIEIGRASCRERV